MGAETGPELFLFACGLLAIVGFSAREATISRSLVIVVYLALLGLHGRYGPPLEEWPAQQAASLFMLNMYGAASLAAYIGLRFATVA